MKYTENKPISTSSGSVSPTRAATDNLCCKLMIHIHNQAGTVNIYNCPPGVGQPVVESPEKCPPELTRDGDCIPLVNDSKSKKNLQARLRPRLANSRVPSVLSAAFFQMVRRFQLGHEPVNDLESACWKIFQRLPPDVKDVFACALRVFDGLPQHQRERLFVRELTYSNDAPVNPERLAQLVSSELIERTSLAVFDQPDCLFRERPGQARRIVNEDDVGGLPTVGICRVNGLRTNSFEPRLSLAEYTPDELQQECSPEIVDGQVRLNCRVQTENCSGNEFLGVCLRVPDIQQGEAVKLEGYNFFSTAARVRLVAKSPGAIVREVETHVCGDITTPVTEMVNGIEVTIADCRVHDKLTFKVPEDMPEGIYGITVIVPNTDSIPGFREEEASFPEQYIQVVTSETAIFQIASELLEAVDETSYSWLGSDEVAIRVIVTPIFLDMTLGDPIVSNFRFGNVDSGDQRDMNRSLFRGSGIGALSLAILGHEVDSEDAYEKLITETTDYFIEILKEQWNWIKDQELFKKAIVGLIKEYGPWGALAVALAGLLLITIDFFVALWAPADLIIQDSAAFTALDLAMLTSANFPPPSVVEYTTPGDIDVKIEPIRKDVQYIERRTYSSDSEDSKYRITLRYNRF